MKRLQAHGIGLPRLRPGFTLVEMAMVLLIVSILLSAFLIPLSMQMELRQYADTKKTMDQINEALIGFVLVNGRLPCPASKTIADGAANVGTELLSGNACTSYTGVIPWVTLGVPETDEWGRRFTYKVTSTFADAIAAATYGAGCTPTVTPTQSSFALCSNGDMGIQSRSTVKVLYNVTNTSSGSQPPAVFISHGKNGYGGYGPLGTLVFAVPAINVDETANANTATLNFISRDKTDHSSSCSDTSGSTPMCEFDDLVAWIPLATLMNRMVVAGKLP